LSVNAHAINGDAPGGCCQGEDACSGEKGKGFGLGTRPRAQWRTYLGPCLAAAVIGALLALTIIGGEFGR
jgi:hypothetical protein